MATLNPALIDSMLGTTGYGSSSASSGGSGGSFWDSLLQGISNNPGAVGAAIGGIGTLLDPAKPQTTTQQQSVQLPDYIAPYVGRMLGQAESLSQEGYNPYPGARLADFNADQQNAFDAYRNLQSPDVSGAAGIATAAATKALNSSYAPSTFEYKPVSSQGVSAQNIDYTGDWDEAAAKKYMDPYQQAVTDIAKREAERAGLAQMQQLKSEAAKRGAFGGSRQAILEAEQSRNQNMLLSDIDAKGRADAFKTGMGQFNTDRSTKNQVSMANQAAALQASKYSADAAARANEFNAQLAMQQQKDQEAARQFAANYGLNGLGLALTGAKTAADIGTSAFNTDLTKANSLLNIGNMQQALDQKGIDIDYQNFLAQQADPYKKLQYMQGFLSGLPMTQTQVANTTPAPSLTQQLIGNTTAGYGIGSIGVPNP